MYFAKRSPFIPIINPGFVQNCPAPPVIESANCVDHLSKSECKALGKIITGLILPISAKTGIGSSLFAAMSYNARPPWILPVKPTPFTCLCATNCAPTVLPPPDRFEKTPSGIPFSLAAFNTTAATISPVPACIE